MHGHISAADRTAGHQFRRDLTVFPRPVHLLEQLHGVIYFVVAAFLTLNLPVVSLGGENIFIRKTSLSELVVHISGQNEMGLILYQLINRPIEGHARRLDPVEICVF